MDEMRTVLRRLGALDPAQRGLAADAVVDWPDAVQAEVGAVASRALEVAVLLEDSDEALESQLHALATLAEWDLVPRDVLRRIPSSRPWTQPWADEYVSYLRDRSAEVG